MKVRTPKDAKERLLAAIASTNEDIYELESGAFIVTGKVGDDIIELGYLSMEAFYSYDVHKYLDTVRFYLSLSKDSLVLPYLLSL